ncbi:MAG: NAD(P)/FAD-dependent oxidoreductase [Oligoflexales bacterium]
MSDSNYNLVIIGGGSAGLVSAAIAAGAKSKVALIEKDRMGGDCLNTGCVPSKAIIRTARFIADMKKHKQLGVKNVNFDFDFKDVMSRVHNVVKAIEPHDSVERFTGLGVECLKGHAELIDANTVKVGDKVLKTKNIILSLGAEPAVPAIPGLKDISYLTSDNLWNLDTLPKKMIVLGGGPIGCELAQAFGRLGTEVTLIEMLPRILIREDIEVSELMTKHLEEDGVKVLTNTKAAEFKAHTLRCEKSDHSEISIDFDEVLVAVGRKPRTDSTDWSRFNIELNANGTFKVDSFMRVNGHNIFAAGDCAGPYQFTHMAAHQAYYCTMNALFRPFKFKANYRVVPWVTFTDPEVGRVGLNEQEAKEQGIPYDVAVYPLDDLDRAMAENSAHGFVKVLTEKGSKKGRVLGSTIVGHHAGEINTEIVAAMQHGFGLSGIASTIHPYPTFSESNKFAATSWKKSTVPSWVFNILQSFHTWRRKD